MRVSEFIQLFEETKPHIEKVPTISSKKIKSFLSSFRKAYNKKENVDGRAQFLLFLDNLEHLQDCLEYVEKKDPTVLNKEDIDDCKKYCDKIKKYIKSKDPVIDYIKSNKVMKGLKEYLKGGIYGRH